MLELDGKIISTDILTTNFCCDLEDCKGICCVEGNAGAPLTLEEVEILEAEYQNYKPYMKGEGVEAIENQGFMVIDDDGDLTTPLINGSECAFSFESEGKTLCAIEKAHRDGKTNFIKPISCHLYPIRVVNFSNGTIGLNYHRWAVCRGALKCGDKIKLPMYKALKNPITRAFGQEFYLALEAAEEFIKTQE